MKFRTVRLTAALAFCVVWSASAASQTDVRRGEPSGSPAGGPKGPLLRTEGLRQTLDKYCASCHNARVKTSATAGGVLLNDTDLTTVAQDPVLWEKVVRKLRTGAMPPAGMPRPDAAAHDALVSYLETTLDREAAAHPNPGRSGPHRLNRAEYANAIRDLLALDVDTATLLPPDDSADGFDNIADVLGASPALLERYLSAASKISALAVGSSSISAEQETYRIRGDASQTEQNDDLPPGTRGGLVAKHLFPLDGEYTFKVKLWMTNLGSVRGLEDTHQLEISVDGERVLLAPVGSEKEYTDAIKNATDVANMLEARLQTRVFVKAGERPVGVAFLAKTATLGDTRLQNFKRSTLIATDHRGLPHVESVTIAGPFNPKGPGDTASRRTVFSCGLSSAAGGRDRGCARSIVARLARRAYRRPVTETDLAPLMKFYDAGRAEAGFERGIEAALRGILVSPKFLIRVERDSPLVRRGEPSGSPALSPVNDIDLASRLSFFLWSSIPDEQLLDLAARGQLSRPVVLDAQVKRMLRDPKSSALVDNFAAQWLHARNLKSATPDKGDFPDFDDNLRQAFERELKLFVASIIREDRGVLDLMTADYTFVNERLAQHYGIPNVYGPQFRRVTLADDARKGLLGKGAVLLVTSHADRTSPVVRGKWILDNLLGAPPPPPPAVVPPLDESAAAATLTMRQRMEKHRENPVCASCHKVMDPIGLALENFDAIGRWRDLDGESPIDASGVLTDGTKVSGAVDLRQALLRRPEVLVGTMTEKLMTYALGRGLDATDMPAVRAVVREASGDQYRFSALVKGIVTSTPFRMRRTDKES
jgi:mono/diheme cytochrome c family protein